MPALAHCTPVSKTTALYIRHAVDLASHGCHGWACSGGDGDVFNCGREAGQAEVIMSIVL